MAEVHFPKPSPDKKGGECELASNSRDFYLDLDEGNRKGIWCSDFIENKNRSCFKNKGLKYVCAGTYISPVALQSSYGFLNLKIS